ncbi:MAG TPA: hypothetical protein VFZ59_13985 [Verrucomicrobiae bacterium]|nr:hypothetical protein [Verrucomicrobiae bacterium]
MSNANTTILPWALGALAIVAVAIGIIYVIRVRQQRTSTPSPPPIQQYPHFVFAKIMDPIDPLVRGEKYEDPLQATLEQKGLGEITGGGTQMDKNKRIEWIGIDMQIANLDTALELVRERLLELGAPKGSVLEFKRGNQELTLPIHSH